MLQFLSTCGLFNVIGSLDSTDSNAGIIIGYLTRTDVERSCGDLICNNIPKSSW